MGRGGGRGIQFAARVLEGFVGFEFVCFVADVSVIFDFRSSPFFFVFRVFFAVSGLLDKLHISF